ALAGRPGGHAQSRHSRMKRAGRVAYLVAIALAALARPLHAADPPLPPLAPESAPRRDDAEFRAQRNPRVAVPKLVPHTPQWLDALRSTTASGSANGTWLTTPPPRLTGAVGILDTRSRRLIVYGGSNDGLLQDALWSLAIDGGSGWQRLTTT